MRGYGSNLANAKVIVKVRCQLWLAPLTVREFTWYSNQLSPSLIPGPEPARFHQRNQRCLGKQNPRLTRESSFSKRCERIFGSMAGLSTASGIWSFHLVVIGASLMCDWGAPGELWPNKLKHRYSSSSRVMVRISAEVTKPYRDRPFDGIFSISIELSPIASPAFEDGRSVSISDSMEFT